MGLFYVLSPVKNASATVEKLAATPAQSQPQPDGSLVCALAGDQSLNAPPQTGSLTLKFDPALGCLNGHSAYVRVDGRYIRLSVNEKDHVASRLELSGDLKTFTRRDYALGDDDLAAIAADRATLAPTNCPTADAVSATEASDVAARVRTLLASNYFNGEPTRVMTWRCAPPIQAAASGAAPSTTLDSR